MRSTPGRPYPLIIPLSTGLGKRCFAKITFPHKVLTTFTQKMVFYLLARGVVAHTAVWGLGGPGGHPKSTKKLHEKKVFKKRSQNRPWGLHGAPQGAPGAQIWPKWEPKGSQNESKNGVFSGSARKMEYVTKPHYLLYIKHISHPRN